MLKLRMLPDVNAAIFKRDETIEALRKLRAHGIGVTIDGGLLNDGCIVMAARKAVEAELVARLDRLNEQLSVMGVDVAG